MPACVIVGVAPPNHVTQLEDVFVILDGKVLFLFVISFTFFVPQPPIPSFFKLLQHIYFMHLIIIVVILCDKKGGINE